LIKAPEVLNGRNKYDKTVDFWSLGIMLFDMLTGSPPFIGGNRKKIMETIMNKKPVFPRYIIATTKDLLIKLLKKDPRVRLGSKKDDDIKKHNYFKNMNWTKLFDKEIDPPFVPEFKDSNDTSHFDDEFTSLPISESLLNERGLKANSSDDFVGFSYVADSFDNN
jgi:serine/threonine protein kinase